MIKSFVHKGLALFFNTGNTKGIQAQHAKKLRNLLAMLDSATVVDDLNAPGTRLHKLHGNLADLWAVDVSGNWRIVFRFEDGDAYVVNYCDYH